jgi:hypothetical protein
MTRLSSRFGGSPPEKREDSLVIDRKINSLLSRTMGINGRLIQNKWNDRGDLSLAFSPGINTETLQNIEEKIRNVLDIRGGTFSRDQACSKVVLHGVRTGADIYEGPFTREQLKEELIEKNTQLKDLKFIHDPDWIVAPDNMGNRPVLSISFAFADANGLKVAQILKTNIYMFGRQVTAKKWEIKKPLRGCDKCLSYEHTQQQCTYRRGFRCATCGDSHSTAEHNDKCQKCRSGGRDKDARCAHPPKCGSCGGAHVWYDDSCPNKNKYRKSVMQILQRTGDEDMAQ